MAHKINEALKYGRDILSKNGIEPREARLLLAYSMGISINDLMKNTDCTEEEHQSFICAINRRIAGEPYAYITGRKEFMKLNLKVNEHTLIPRDDTEILVEKAIEIIETYQESRKVIPLLKKEMRKLRILDMCTGSGCIAISIAKYTSNVIIDASDISKEALSVASENVYGNQVKVNLIHSNLFEKINHQYDIIISNPPYIVSNEISKLQQEVQREPHIALDGGEDGLDFYRKIAKDAINFLRPNAYLLFEIGYDQGEAVSKILGENCYTNIEVIKDFSENDRVVIANYYID